MWIHCLFPDAIAFTTAKQSMDNRNLVEIYKAGLRQIPIPLGCRRFSRINRETS